MKVTTLNHFSQDIFSSNPLSNLTTNQKIITAVALVALSCIALAVFFYRRGSFSQPIIVQSAPQKAPIIKQPDNNTSKKDNSRIHNDIVNVTVSSEKTPLIPQPIIEPTKKNESTIPVQSTPKIDLLGGSIDWQCCLRSLDRCC